MLVTQQAVNSHAHAITTAERALTKESDLAHERLKLTQQVLEKEHKALAKEIQTKTKEYTALKSQITDDERDGK